MQDILTYIALILAISYLIKKFFLPKKKKKSCGIDCGCWWNTYPLLMRCGNANDMDFRCYYYSINTKIVIKLFVRW